MDSTPSPFCSVPGCRSAAYRDGLCVDHLIARAIAAERERCTDALRLVIFGEIMRAKYTPDTSGLRAAIRVIDDKSAEAAERESIAAALAPRDSDVCRVIIERYHSQCPGCNACAAARARIIPLRK